MKAIFKDRPAILAILFIMISVLMIVASFAIPGKRTYISNESSGYNEYIPEYLDKDDARIIDNRAVVANRQEQDINVMLKGRELDN